MDFWVEALRTWAVQEEELVCEADLEVQRDGVTTRRGVWTPGDGWGDPAATEALWTARVRLGWDHPRIALDLDGEALLRVNGRAVLGVNQNHLFVDLAAAVGEEPASLSLRLSRLGVMGRRFDDPRVRRVAVQRIDHNLLAAALDLEVLAEWGRHPDTPAAHRDALAGRLAAALQPLTGLPADLGAWTGWLRRTGGGADDEALFLTLIKRRETVDGLRRIEPAVRNRAAADAAARLSEIRRWLRDHFPKSPGQVLALGHAHIDWAWLWRVSDTRAKVVRTLASQMTLLDRYPEWVYGMSSPMMWQAADEDEPDLAARASRLAREGRIEPLGAFWVESDGQLPQASAYLRHLAYTFRAFKRRAGAVAPIAFLPDTFGFAAPLPTLLAAAGVRLFLTTKINWNDSTVFPYKDFWWVGPDGSRVQAQIFGQCAFGYNGLATVDNIREAWRRYQAEGGAREVLYTFGLGDGGGGPDQNQLERLFRYRELPDMPTVRFGRPESLLAAEDEPLPVFRGELYLEFHRGVFTTQTRVKRETRRLESWLVAVEAWNAWSGRDEQLEPVWTRLLATHFHDILPGSSIGPVYRDWEDDHAAVQGAVDVGVQALRGFLERQRPTGDDALLLINPADVRAPAGLVTIASQDDVDLVVGETVVRGQRTHDGGMAFPVPEIPALGAASFALRPGEPLPASAPRTVSEVAVTFPSGGAAVNAEGVRSLVHGGRELLAEPAGIRAFYNHPGMFDAWELDAGYRANPARLAHDPPEIVEEGPLRTVVRLRHTTGQSAIVEHVTLDRVTGQVSSEIAAEVHDRHLLLRYEVPTTLHAEYAVAETLYGAVNRPTVPAGPQDAARFEWVAHRFVDLSEPRVGLALINDGRFGHSADGGRLGLTISTAPLYPDPAADIRPAPLRILLMPHDGDWRAGGVLPAAHAWSLPRAAMMARVQPDCRLCPVDGLPDNLVLMGFKQSQDGQAFLLYLGETYGDQTSARLRLPFGVRAAARADLVTEEPQAASHGVRRGGAPGTIEVDIPPRGLAIVRVEPERAP
ncbi:MAG: alpha-mannosidase [Clostridia bacterium]